MALSDDQHLQTITLSKIPVPHKNIAYQELLTKPGIAFYGQLKRKKPWKILNKNIGALLQSIAWEQKYVVVYNGCLYLYNSPNDSKPDKAISLFGYTRVMRAGELRSSPWPFKVAYVLDDKDRVHYFSASCEQEMLKWLKHIKRELYRANGVDYSEDSDEDINDLETPISTENYFNRIQNLEKIKKDVRADDDNDDDSDMEDDDYDYIDEEDRPTNRPSASKAAVAMKPANTKEPKVPKKPGGRSPNPELPIKKPSSSSSSPRLPGPGYYPPILTSDSGGASPKPLPPTPLKPVPLPALKKVLPATPMKPRAIANDGNPSWKSEAVLSGRRSPEDSPRATASAGSVAELRKGLFGDHMPKPPKPNVVPKPPVEAPVPSSSGVTKPLPPVPLSSKRSNAPTAVVSPVRQTSAAPQTAPKQNRFPKDLDMSAMWTEDPGEGQRLLVKLGQEGVYMLRQCTDGSRGLTLLVIADCQLRKYKIFVDEEGMFSLTTDSAQSFDSVHNLLNYYRTNFLPRRRTKLSSAYSEVSNS